MGFPWQEFWSGLPFPSPGDLLNPGIELVSPALEADALTSEPPGKPKNEADHEGTQTLNLLIGLVVVYLNGLVLFSTFFNFSVNLAIRSS